tara:strand:- start:453 stop:677 length:225 start_codon:yes stop_codon:yes gene_type:complete
MEKDKTKVFDMVVAELTLLQAEHIEPLTIAEQSLRAVMQFTLQAAPTKLNGIHLCSHVFHDIITDATLKQMEGK